MGNGEGGIGLLRSEEEGSRVEWGSAGGKACTGVHILPAGVCGVGGYNKHAIQQAGAGTAQCLDRLIG